MKTAIIDEQIKDVDGGLIGVAITLYNIISD